MLASLASTRNSSRCPSSNTCSWSEKTAIAPIAWSYATSGTQQKHPHFAQGLHSQLLHFRNEVVANQYRLPRSNHILRQVIPGAAAAPRQARPSANFQVKAHLVANRIELGNIEILDIKQPPQFLPDLTEQIFLVQRRAQRPPDFVQHVQFFGAPRSLLHQVTVLHRHADLVSQRQQQAILRRRESPAVRRSQQQHAERLLFRL